MKKSSKTISPLRQRMLEDMRMRKLKPGTQSSYIRAVERLSQHLGHSPHTATAEDLRNFQIHLADTGVSGTTINAYVTALRFFYKTTVGKPEITDKLSSVPVPRKVPHVLNTEEVTQLLEATISAKYRAALSVAYGAGLRVNELVHLRVCDIDSKRMVLYVCQGKGGRDRYAMLSPVLLDILRRWWVIGSSYSLMRKSGWLFPGLNPIEHVSTRHINRVVHEAARSAKIEKRVSPHLLRHCFATHLLEQGVDIRVIQVLLGHKKLESTARYSQVASSVLREVKSPLDGLALPPTI